MKVKKLALATAIVAASTGASFVHADAQCTAVAGGSATCEQDAEGSPIVGSVPVGVVVSTVVRDRMQSLLFPGTMCDPAGTGHATLGDSRTCMPSLSSAEVSALFTGAISGWTNVSTANGVVAGGGVANNSKLCGLHTGVQTMGTAATNTAGSCAVPTASTSEGDNIAAIESCMVATTGKGSSASIGVLPVSQLPNADYRFIKVDGVAPTLAEHLSANYPIIANVAGSPTFGTFNQSWGIAGGDTVANGAPSKDTSGVSFGCAPVRSNSIFQD